MTPLTLAMRNELARDPEFAALVGSSAKWPVWVFVDKPEVRLENSQKALVVISEYNQWTTLNMHNTMDFPTVLIDIWADPTRNADKSVRVEDASLKIDDIYRVVQKHFHTANLSRPGGGTLQWGTEAEVSAGEGVWVNGSHKIDGPVLGDVPNIPGAKVSAYRYGVNLIS